MPLGSTGAVDGTPKGEGLFATFRSARRGRGMHARVLPLVLHGGGPSVPPSDLPEPDPDSGLSLTEVRRRLERFGPNEGPERKESAGLRFLRRFTGLTPWMLEG